MFLASCEQRVVLTTFLSPPEDVVASQIATAATVMGVAILPGDPLRVQKLEVQTELACLTEAYPGYFDEFTWPQAAASNAFQWSLAAREKVKKAIGEVAEDYRPGHGVVQHVVVTHAYVCKLGFKLMTLGKAMAPQ